MNLLDLTTFTQKLNDLDLSEHQLRVLLFRYCKEYQDCFSIDCLEEAIEYLEEKIINSSNEMDELLDNIKEEVYPWTAEFVTSAKVAEVVLFLLEGQKLTKCILLEKLEDILFSIEANSQDGFMIEEEKTLMKILNEIKS